MSLPHAIRWAFLSEIASKAITPLVFVVLARLLAPEDYGVVAAATMVISFSQIFWEAGLGKALIQYQGDRSAAANAAFWINNLLGVVVAVLLVIVSPLIADGIFHDHRVTMVLQAMALQIFLSAAASVPSALLQRDMQFKRLFWVRLMTVSAPGLVSIPLAWLGMGYWALVGGTIAGQATQVAILWYMSEWRPSFKFDTAVAHRLIGFGIWVAASGLAGWFYLWADSLIVGMYLGAHDLGLYRTGNAFVMMIYGFLFAPLLPVLYSHLSGIQADQARVERVLSKVVRMITFLAIPAAFLLYLSAEPVSRIVFGANWQGIGLVIAVLSLVHGFAWTVGANGEAYRAIGRPDVETKIMSAALLVFSLAYWLSIRHGFEAFLWTRFSMVIFGIGLHLWAAHVTVRLPIAGALLYVLKVSVVGVPLVVLQHYVEFGDEHMLQQLTIVMVAACAWTAIYLWLIERRSLIPEFAGLLRRSLGTARHSDAP